MNEEYRHILTVALIVSAVLTPGNVLRYARYRTLGDVLATGANVSVIIAVCWELWGWERASPSNYLGPLIVTVILWLGAAILVLFSLIQLRVVGVSYYRERVANLGALKRILFGLGCVWFGKTPDSLRTIRTVISGDATLAIRPARTLLLWSGLSLIGIGIVVISQTGLAGLIGEVCIRVVTLGVLCLAGFAVDSFVSIQRKKHFVSGGIKPRECIVCGYTLRGLTTNRCPECGTEFGRGNVVNEKSP